jgi:hypothetical protein
MGWYGLDSSGSGTRQQAACYLLHVSFLLGLFIDPEGEDDMLLRNVGSNELHGIISQKIELLMTTAVMTDFRLNTVE